MKLIRFLAFPVLVIALWVGFAAATLSGLATVGSSLRTIGTAAQPEARPSDAPAPERNPRVAHGVPVQPGAGHPG